VTAAPFAAIAASPSARASLRIGGLLVALGAIVGARWAATVGGVGDALTIGLAFGLALTALAILAGERVGMPRPAALAIGAAGGAALVGLALLAHLGAPGPSLAPAAAFPAVGLDHDSRRRRQRSSSCAACCSPPSGDMPASRPLSP